MFLPSNKSKEELTKSFDTVTSPQRFAGSDDVLDEIFLSKRKGDKIFISKKPRLVFDMFATVFRGRIVKTEKGSAIKGIFTVNIIDYIVTLLLGTAYGYIIFTHGERAEWANKKDVILLAVFGVAVGIFALVPKIGKMKEFSEFLKRIAESEEK